MSTRMPDENDPRRCTAKSSRSQQRCKKWAIEHGTVCRTHGGAAPQVRKAALDRLESLVFPALNTLRKVIDNPEHPFNVRAAFGVIDRTIMRLGGEQTRKIQKTRKKK